MLVSRKCEVELPVSITEYLQNSLLQLDVEFGNASGFFSASKRGIPTGWVFETDIERDVAQLGQSFEYEAQIPGAIMAINDDVVTTENELNRSVRFATTQSSNLYDLVSRFVVLSNDRSANIAGRSIQHNCRNIYHQYGADTVIVPIGADGFLKFLGDGTSRHPMFEDVFYIRDEAVEETGLKRWIVHHRMIVNEKTANLVVRVCHSKFDRPLPLQWLIPHALKKWLFRIRERRFPYCPIMAVGETTIPGNHRLNIRTSIRLVNE